MTSTEFQKASAEFRTFLPDLNTPRFQIAKQQNPYEYVRDFNEKHVPPWLYNLTQAWKQLLAEPYKGVTTDGQVKTDLFHDQDEGVPIEAIAKAAEEVLHNATAEQRQKLQYTMNAQEWRAWSNPEFLLRPFGLRLEEVDETLKDAICAVIEATLSPEGYRKARAAMNINHFLGELCEVPRIMNRSSYNFLLFGTPSTGKAWGWSLYGHHLCLSAFLKGPQVMISPSFTGAEPNIIDDGPLFGAEIMQHEGTLGLKLMQSLLSDLQEKAQTFKLMKDPGMKQTGDLTTDRWNQDDQRHLCGAFRDNRVIPYEGIVVGKLSAEQQQLILDIVEQFLLYHPKQTRDMKKRLVQKHFDETYFSWIGEYGDDNPYYFRIQSPVIICEFDHHSGVFLTNKEPAKFHIHTIVRTPNGGDYGNALRAPADKLQ